MILNYKSFSYLQFDQDDHKIANLISFQGHFQLFADLSEGHYILKWFDYVMLEIIT